MAGVIVEQEADSRKTSWSTVAAALLVHAGLGTDPKPSASADDLPNGHQHAGADICPVSLDVGLYIFIKPTMQRLVVFLLFSYWKS